MLSRSSSDVSIFVAFGMAAMKLWFSSHEANVFRTARMITQPVNGVASKVTQRWYLLLANLVCAAHSERFS